MPYLTISLGNIDYLSNTVLFLKNQIIKIRKGIRYLSSKLHARNYQNHVQNNW